MLLIVLYKDTHILDSLCQVLRHALAYLSMSAEKLIGSNDVALPLSPVCGFILPVLLRGVFGLLYPLLDRFPKSYVFGI